MDSWFSLSEPCTEIRYEKIKFSIISKIFSSGTSWPPKITYYSPYQPQYTHCAFSFSSTKAHLCWLLLSLVEQNQNFPQSWDFQCHLSPSFFRYHSFLSPLAHFKPCWEYFHPTPGPRDTWRQKYNLFSFVLCLHFLFFYSQKKIFISLNF